MRHRQLPVALGVCCWLLATTVVANSAALEGNNALQESNWLASASQRIRQRTKDRSHVAWFAYELTRSELARRPSDPRLQLEAAEALLKYIRHTTNGSFPRASTGKVSEGDSPESRRVWRKHAPEALRLLKAGTTYAEKSGSYELAKYRFLFAEASTYLSNAKGTLRAALQADAVTFKRNVKPLIEEHPAYQGGVGHTFMGAFHLAAPWPVYNLAKAKAHFDAALRIDPACRRNQYCRGLVALESGDAAQARAYFQKAVKCRPTSPEEEDVGDFFREESLAALKALKKVVLLAILGG